MTDDDLKAIFSYLRTVPPVKHRVDNTEPPTYCPICKTVHGAGNLNYVQPNPPAKESASGGAAPVVHRQGILAHLMGGG